MWPGRFSHFCFDRGHLLRILPVFTKNYVTNSAPERLIRQGGAFTRIITIPNYSVELSEHWYPCTRIVCVSLDFMFPLSS